MPSSSEIARVMAEMDRFNKSVTVTEERYEKRVASVGGSYGGLTALLQQGAPGNWASDHKSEAEKFSGWHYVAITSIGKAVRSSAVEAYQEKVREYAKGYNEQDEDTTPLPKWHPLMKLLKRPNPSQSGASFREEMAIQLCLTGSALVWNVPNQMGRTVERYVIPTAIAEPRQPEKGLPKGGWYINPEVARWQIESGWFLYTGLATAIGKVIDARDVQVVRFIHPVFKDEGQSPVSAGALWTDTSEKIDISRHAHLRNGSDPSVIIGIDGVEDEGTLQRMSAKFNEKYAGPSKHGKAMFVNGQNVKVEPVTRTPAEMAYEGAFAQFRDAIMALHGVTPIAAGIEAPSGDDGLYAPLKQFVVGTVQPILDLMAEEDTEQLASQFGEGVSVLYTARAIDDAKLTEQQINTDIAAGAIEVDEIRKLRGRKPWGGEKGKAVAGQGAKEEPQQGLPGLAQGVPGLEPQTGPQALDPSKPPKGTPDPMKLAEEAVAKALGGFADRLSALLKSDSGCVKLQPGDTVTRELPGIVAKGSDCGANGPGGGGFQPGNTCGSRDSGSSEGSGGSKPGKGSKVYDWALEKFKDEETARNFTEWFGDSKVVDAEGNPITVFHGAEDYRSEVDGIFVTDDPAMATRYAELKAVEQAVSENSELESIVYGVMAEEGADALTDLGPDRIKEIADANGFEIPDTSGKVDSLWVRSVNPLDLREHGSDVGNVGELWDSMHSAGLLDDSWDSLDEDARYEVESQYDGKALYNFLEDEGIQAKAFDRGFDSVIFVDIAPDGGATHDSWLVKEGNQVKSDRNSGKFSRDSKDVTKSGSSCGANAQGGGGFQPGNTCGKRDGKGGESSEGGGKGSGVNPKILAWAREKFGDDTTAENFAKWFGDSKVVDEDGNPLTVYHGTDGSFDEFDPSLPGKVDTGGGLFFTDSKSVASGYGEIVKPVYLSALDVVELDFNGRSSVYFDGKERTPSELSVRISEINSDLKEGYSVGDELKDELDSLGWSILVANKIDGIKLKNVNDNATFAGGGKIATHYVVFSPTQIKSATGNSGTFDPKDPNITKSGSGCGANAEGGGGFQPGNTCGKEDGAGEGEVVKASSLKSRLEGSNSGVATVGPIKLEAYRVGGLDASRRGGVFFAGDRAGAEAYASLHNGSKVEEFVVEFENAVVAGHQNDLTRAWFGKPYGQMMDQYQSRYGKEGAGVASAKFDKKILSEAKKRGFDGIVYLKPAPPAETEVVVIGKPGKRVIKKFLSSPNQSRKKAASKPAKRGTIRRKKGK